METEIRRHAPLGQKGPLPADARGVVLRFQVFLLVCGVMF